MNFAVLPTELHDIATKALAFCRSQYGSKGLKIESGIDSKISWRPTFYLTRAKYDVLAFEVNDVVLPDVLKVAAQDIKHHGQNVRITQVLPHDVYIDPKHQKRVRELKDQGFGIITVNKDGVVDLQCDCVPQLQFVSKDTLEDKIKTLPNSIKVKLRAAYAVYATDAVQGNQAAGQIVEGLVKGWGRQAAKVNDITDPQSKLDLAKLIDVLYKVDKYDPHRPALGAARVFARLDRNPASHPPKNPKEAAQRVQNSRDAFLSSLKTASLLAETIKKLGLRVQLY